jgi:hypothetical protein
LRDDATLIVISALAKSPKYSREDVQKCVAV